MIPDWKCSGKHHVVCQYLYNMWARAILTKVRDRGHMTSPPPLLRVTMWTATIFVKLKRDFTAIFTSPTKETLGLQYTLG